MFRKNYILRRYGEQGREAGYASFSYVDKMVSLNVQPLSTKELEALPEGGRSQQGIKAFGGFPVRTANQTSGTPADRLFYLGKWYECETSSNWDHTPLAHYESQWTAVPECDEEPPLDGSEGSGSDYFDT